MGTDIASIQAAYTGFSKQNYTMLDNLKLGYGGTKTEMERLIADANKLRRQQGIHTRLSINSYADIVTAINTVQKEMGIYGTTSKEAAQTISGSLSSLKASWQNLLVGLAGGGEDLSQLINNVFSSAKTYIENVVPVVRTALSNIWASVKALLIEKFPQIGAIMSNIESAFNNVVAFVQNYVIPNLKNIIPIITAIAAAFVTAKTAIGIGKLIESIGQVKTAISAVFTLVKANPFVLIIAAIAALISYFVTLYNTNEEFRAKVQAAWEKIKEVWETVLKPAFVALYTYVKEVVVPRLIELWNSAKDKIGAVFEKIKTIWETVLKPAFQAIWTFITETLLPALTTLWTETIQPALTGVFNAIKTLWNTVLKPVFNALKTFIVEHVVTAFQAIATFWEETLKPNLQALSAAFSRFKTTVLDPIVTFIKDKFVAAWEAISSLFTGGLKDSVDGENGILGTLKNLWDTILKPLATWIGQVFLTKFENIKTVLTGLITFFTDVFNGDWEGAWNAIVETFKTVWGNIVEVAKTPVNAVIGLLNKMIDAVETALNNVINGINSHLKIEIPSITLPFGAGEFGGWKWSANLPNVEWGRIPELAKGGILRDGQAIFAEAGPEALSVRGGKAYVQPLSASSKISGVSNDEVVALLKQYLPMLANMKIVLDSGTLVGEMNRGLGRQAVYSMRYNAT